jgi:hypothetical protein
VSEVQSWKHVDLPLPGDCGCRRGERVYPQTPRVVVFCTTRLSVMVFHPGAGGNRGFTLNSSIQTRNPPRPKAQRRNPCEPGPDSLRDTRTLYGAFVRICSWIAELTFFAISSALRDFRSLMAGGRAPVSSRESASWGGRDLAGRWQDAGTSGIYLLYSEVLEWVVLLGVNVGM